MIKDVWCNVIIPFIKAVEIKDENEDAFAKVEKLFEEGDPDIINRIQTSFNEGHAVIEWQEMDEIVEEPNGSEDVQNN